LTRVVLSSIVLLSAALLAWPSQTRARPAFAVLSEHVRAAITPHGAGLHVVPVVACPTSFGAPPSRLPGLPKSVALTVSKRVAGGAAVYTDKLGAMRLIGPRGWKFSAEIGADGSGGVQVSPAGHRSGDIGVTGHETSACVGCTLEQACRLFTKARRLLRSEYRQGCPPRPTRERVSSLSPDIAEFTDPPGVAGDGNPSGGSYAALGVMTYYPPASRRGMNGSWEYTCTLAATRAALCSAGASTFVRWYGAR